MALKPWGEFPLNDDWAYALTARSLAEHGRLVLSEWTAVSLAAQAAWGALFLRLLGPGYGVLRLSTFVLAWLGGSAFYFHLRRSGRPQGFSAALSLLLLFNPLVFVLSPTFMTDVPALAFCVLAAAVSAGGLDGGAPDALWLLAGSVFSALAYGTRQTALLLPVGLTCVLLYRRRPSASDLPAIWLLPAAAVLAHGLWFHLRHGTTAGFEVNVRLTREQWAAPLAVLLKAGRRTCEAALYCGLFASPLAAAFLADRPLSGLKEIPPARRWIVGGLSATLLVFLLFDGRLPSYGQGSYLGPGGLGCINVLGARVLPGLGRPGLWLALSGLAWVSFTVLAAAFAAWPEGGMLSFAFPLALTFAGALPYVNFYDRYLLPLIPAALVLGAQGLGTGRRSQAVLWAGVLLVASFSWLGTQDYLAVGEAAWTFGEEAVRRGTPAERVYASYEWCMSRQYPELIRSLRESRPGGTISSDDLHGLCRNPLAIVSFQEKLGGPYAPVAEKEFWSPLARSREKLYLHVQSGI